MIACVAVSVGLLSLGLHPSVRTEFLVPGPLTNPHAQILQRNGSQNRCAECHPAGNQSPLEWIANVLACAKDCRTTQTELCVKCHKQQIKPELATSPHNLPRQVLQTKSEAHRQRANDSDRVLAGLLAWSGRRENAADQQLACAACHQEHHGSGFDLKTLTDQQCQACHQGEFHSFTHGHPEFPQDVGRHGARQIPFDHAQHAGKHFPDKKAVFECRRCHESDASGQVQRLVDYRRACAECHDQPLQTVHQPGWALFSIPTLDVERAREAGVTVARWPASAQGDCDGRLPPLMVALLLADSEAAPAIQKLAPHFDLAQLNLDNQEHMRVAGQVGQGIERLVRELQTEPLTVVCRRFETALGRTLTAEERQRFQSNFPAELIGQAAATWFENQGNQAGSKQERSNATVLNRAATRWNPPVVPDGSLSRFAAKRQQGGSPFRFATWLASSETLVENPLGGRHNAAKRSAVDEPAATSAIPLPQHTQPTPALPSVVPPPATVARTTASGDLLVENPLRGRLPTPATPNGSGTPASARSEPAPLATAAPTPNVADPEKPATTPSSNVPTATKPIAKSALPGNLVAPWQPPSPPNVNGEPLVPNPLRERRAASPVAAPPATPMPSVPDPVISPSTPNEPIPLSAPSQQVSPAIEPTTTVTSEPIPVTPAPVAEPPVAETRESEATSPVAPLALTNWTVEDATLTVRYRPQGHGDPVLRLCLEVLQQLSSSLEGSSAVREAARTDMTLQACVRCHQWSPEQPTDSASWRAVARDPMKRGFTKFSHRPHLTQPQLQDCAHCHQLALSSAASDPSNTPTQPATQSTTVPAHRAPHGDFLPLKKATCASCHHSGGTSQACTQCHRYHIEG